MSKGKEMPPYYEIIDPPLPDNLVLSDVRINKKIDTDHKALLANLKTSMALFQDRQRFWLEVSTLNRLHYKNMNQHRSFTRFQRGMELRRLLKRLRAFSIDKEIERLYKSFWNVKNLDQCTGNWNYIPSKESIQYTMHRLIATALILDRLKITLVETYRANSTLLKLEHFVSLALVYMGICSRLYKLSHVWLSQIEECYHLLYNWSLCFPSGFKEKAEKAFISTHNLHCGADTLKLARSRYSQKVMKSKSSNQHKVHLETYMANPVVMEKVQELNNECKSLEDASNHENTDFDLMDFEDLGEVIQR